MSSNDSADTSFNAGMSQDWPALYDATSKRISAGYNRIGKETLAAAKEDAEMVLERYVHALNATHKAEINDIYGKLLKALSEEDELLAPIYNEIAGLDKEVQVAIEGFVSGIKRDGDQAGIVAKGCKVTIVNAVSEEHKAVEVVKMGLEGGGAKKGRKSDETLVESNNEGSEMDED